jgi:ketosteroid isomerase-like protein
VRQSELRARAGRPEFDGRRIVDEAPAEMTVDRAHNFLSGRTNLDPTIHFTPCRGQDPHCPKNVNSHIHSELAGAPAGARATRCAGIASPLFPNPFQELSMRPWFLAVLAVAAVACRPAPPPLTDADKTAIRAGGDSFVVFFRTDRDSAMAALYTENAVLMPPNQGAVEGRAAIRAFFGGFPALPDFTGTPVDIDGRGDLAYVRGTYSLTVPVMGGRPAQSDHGKFVEIRRRQPDGKWLVSVDIFNSDMPLPAR